MLVVFAGASAVLTGILAIVSREQPSVAHRWLVGGSWVLLGLAIFTWRGVTVGAFAIAVGVGLVAHGSIDVISGLTGRAVERAATALGGLVAVVFGVLALLWPDATVLVVAVLFGARTVLYGISQLTSLVRTHAANDEAASEPSPLRRRLHIVGRAAALVVAFGLLALSVALRDDDRTISAFYETPDEIPATPGELLRVERYSDGIPGNAEAWLILYSTQTSLGAPTVATAVVMAPKEPSTGPRPVIAWTHGTVGIDQRCAPSLSGDPFADLPVGEVVDHGWVMVATDYAGIGTEGVSSYLVGTGQARSTLDSIRAAHQLTELDLSDNTMVWGHSQGGHAALWTGILADDYAPELTIDGVVALSPATNISAMAEAVQGQLGGALGSAYVISAYSDTYDDVSFDDYVRPGARVEVREAAKRCLTDPALLLSIITSLPATQSVFSVDPTTGPLGERLAEITSPLLVVQGTGDEVIPFSITEAWVAERCAAGHHLEFIGLPDRTHMGIFEPDSGLTEKLISWTGDRFTGAPTTPAC